MTDLQKKVRQAFKFHAYCCKQMPQRQPQFTNALLHDIKKHVKNG